LHRDKYSKHGKRSDDGGGNNDDDYDDDDDYYYYYYYSNDNNVCEVDLMVLTLSVPNQIQCVIRVT
jgi:hypothetical protein